MEGRLVSRVFDRMLIQRGYQPKVLAEIREAIRFVEDYSDGLGFCLSENGDLLSQWRGYAEDGQGFSVGFSDEYLTELQDGLGQGEPKFNISKVRYQDQEHEDALAPILNGMDEIVKAGKLEIPENKLLALIQGEYQTPPSRKPGDARSDLWFKAVEAAASVYTLKNAAFSEEVEWRLLSYLRKYRDDTAHYRAAGNRLVPYREIVLKPMATPAIVDVYIGPKNITPEFVVQKFLKQSGFDEVTVTRSAATYR